jgi:hypothetical protein
VSRVRFSAGELLEFELLLTGELASRAPSVLMALAATRLRLGVGGPAPRLIDCGWLDAAGQPVSLAFAPAPPTAGYPLVEGRSLAAHRAGATDRLVIDFLTPTEITLKHGRRVRSVDDLSFRLLLVRSYQKLQALLPEDAIGDVPADELAVLLAAADRVGLETAELKWCRIPLRHKGRNPRGGIVGRVVFRGETALFLPLLEAVRRVGLGKGPVYGLGQIDYRFIRG